MTPDLKELKDALGYLTEVTPRVDGDAWQTVLSAAQAYADIYPDLVEMIEVRKQLDTLDANDRKKLMENFRKAYQFNLTAANAISRIAERMG